MKNDIDLSAGHSDKDPGAINKFGVKEAELTKELRNLIIENLKCYNNTVRKDFDWETNSQYQGRLKARTDAAKSILLDIHFNSFHTESANGSEVVISANASSISKGLGTELLAITTKVLGTRSRGLLKDTETPRGRIGILNLAGPAVLLEVCFISNPSDLAKYNKHKKELAFEIAKLLVKYDNLLNT